MDLPLTSMIFLSPLRKSEALPTTTFIRSPLAVRYRHISVRARESQARPPAPCPRERTGHPGAVLRAYITVNCSYGRPRALPERRRAGLPCAVMSPIKPGAVDCDVHVEPPSMDALLGYIDPYW